jgi:dTDP-4-amino-4,6-dideoxygalactose transaminase
MNFNLDSISRLSDIYNWRFLSICRNNNKQEIERRINRVLGRLVKKKYQILTPSGRSAVYILAKYLSDKDKRTNIVIPAFTCVVVPNSVKAAGHELRYCDIDLDTLSLNLDHLDSIVDENTKAIVVQHVLGFTDNQIKIIRDRYKGIFIIEDCAHSLMVKYSQQSSFTGSLGDAAFFSFDHTKSVTCFGGGALLTNNEDVYKYADKKLQSLKNSGLINEVYIFIKYTLIFLLNTGEKKLIKKILFAAAVRILRLKPTMTSKELQGDYVFTEQNRLGVWRIKLLYFQLLRRNSVARIRCRNFKILNGIFSNYDGEVLPALRYMVFKRQVTGHKLYNHMGNWFSSPIHPIKDRFHLFDYKMGSCPNAEWLSDNVLNIPTGPRCNTNVW